MPAVDLARLKIQTASLADHFGEPEEFVRLLQEILGFYTNHTKRRSAASLRTRLPSYRTPRPVLRQMINEISRLAPGQPQSAVKLIDVLWNTAFLETRLFAASLLGQTPPETALSLLTRLPIWLEETKDKEIERALLTDSLSSIRVSRSEAFLPLVEDWLSDGDPRIQGWGLKALLPLLYEPGFDNLPTVFRMIRPAIENVSSVTQTDLLECINALDRISFQETSNFVITVLTQSKNAQLARNLRRISADMSEKMQKSLRDHLRANT